VTLQPGQRTQVRFQVGAKELGFHNRQMKFVVEPGEFRVMVGANSAEVIEKSFQVTGP
jgi:beta-glucosidase